MVSPRIQAAHQMRKKIDKTKGNLVLWASIVGFNFFFFFLFVIFYFVFILFDEVSQHYGKTIERTAKGAKRKGNRKTCSLVDHLRTTPTTNRIGERKPKVIDRRRRYIYDVSFDFRAISFHPEEVAGPLIEGTGVGAWEKWERKKGKQTHIKDNVNIIVRAYCIPSPRRNVDTKSRCKMEANTY